MVSQFHCVSCIVLCLCEVGVADALLKIALNDIGMSRHFEDVTCQFFVDPPTFCGYRSMTEALNDTPVNKITLIALMLTY